MMRAVRVVVMMVLDLIPWVVCIAVVVALAFGIQHATDHFPLASAVCAWISLSLAGLLCAYLVGGIVWDYYTNTIERTNGGRKWPWERSK